MPICCSSSSAGESYRAKEAQERLAARARQRSAKSGKGKL